VTEASPGSRLEPFVEFRQVSCRQKILKRLSFFNIYDITKIHRAIWILLAASG